MLALYDPYGYIYVIALVVMALLAAVVVVKEVVFWVDKWRTRKRLSTMDETLMRGLNQEILSPNEAREIKRAQGEDFLRGKG